MTEIIFYTVAMIGALALIFGTQPLLKKMGIKLEDVILEKVTGAFVALYFCVAVFLYITNAQ